MQNKLPAIERQEMLERIHDLESMFNAMHEDFAKCAHGVSPCFYCAIDNVCSGCAEDCNFIWDKHN